MLDNTRTIYGHPTLVEGLCLGDPQDVVVEINGSVRSLIAYFLVCRAYATREWVAPTVVSVYYSQCYDEEILSWVERLPYSSVLRKSGTRSLNQDLIEYAKNKKAKYLVQDSHVTQLETMTQCSTALWYSMQEDLLVYAWYHKLWVPKSEYSPWLTLDDFVRNSVELFVKEY